LRNCPQCGGKLAAQGLLADRVECDSCEVSIETDWKSRAAAYLITGIVSEGAGLLVLELNHSRLAATAAFVIALFVSWPLVSFWLVKPVVK
jgi:uncharacterized protein (DUF983 family)